MVSTSMLKTVMIGVAITVIAGLLIYALMLAELYTQLARYKNYWDVNNAQTVERKGRAYVAFGDSAAQGVGASKPENGYVGLIYKDLRQADPDLRLINLSKSGAKVHDVLEVQLPRYEQLNLPADTIITIEIGANDMLTYDHNTFEREMDQLMARLPKTAVISEIPYFGGTRFRKFQPNAVDANNTMHKLADKHGFKLAKLYDKVRNNTGLSTLAADIFHPSDKAYRENWSRVFLDELDVNNSSR